MNDKEKQILDILNSEFPIGKEPFSILSKKMGIDVGSVIDSLLKLKKLGYVRRIGATINPRKLGWISTLCAVDVSEDKIDIYSRTVNSFTEITHNYEREGSPNCWFTVIAPNQKKIDSIVSEIESACGLKIIQLPARRLFKIDVRFSI